MKLVESILTKNPCYTAGRKITVKGLMLHSVGCSQPSALAFIKNWNSPSFDRACVHGFIDGNDGTVYQTLPWNHRGWHCGSSINGSANNTHAGVQSVRRHIVGGTNRALISVETPIRLCRNGTCRRLSAGLPQIVVALFEEQLCCF